MNNFTVPMSLVDYILVIFFFFATTQISQRCKFSVNSLFILFPAAFFVIMKI
jgi:hypothetical protein